MDGVADMGGTEGWGAAHPPQAEELVFPEPWQGRAFALTLLSIQLAGLNVDAFRHAIERLDRTAYLADGYFGRWFNSAELMLTESAILAPSAIRARALNLSGGQVEEPPIPEPAEPSGYAPTAEGSLRTLDTAPEFAVGEQVRAKDMSPPGHTRLAGYVRGHTGVVALIQPASVLPDTNAHFQGENPQYVYSVRFDSHELWGADAESFALNIEMFESYLERTA
ncbi:nitrile hydratase subunit beta [Streptomyces sp. NPDC005132]|uniref:nitrile hydratase subunit beta n=1 Tax=Streptomyces sp. NPDC005132 TaxID=3154294 RepID=UPI0033A0DC57